LRLLGVSLSDLPLEIQSVLAPLFEMFHSATLMGESTRPFIIGVGSVEASKAVEHTW
jgi:hypothetical protein